MNISLVNGEKNHSRLSMWDHSQALVGYCFTLSQSYSTEQGDMIMETELRTTANMNTHYINTAPITFIHSEFRNLTSPQMKNTPARISVCNNIKWMDSASSARSTTRRFSRFTQCAYFSSNPRSWRANHSSSFNFSDFQMLLLSLLLFGQLPDVPFPHNLASATLLLMLLPSTYQIIQASRDLLWCTEQREPHPSCSSSIDPGWSFNWEMAIVGFLGFLIQTGSGL